MGNTNLLSFFKASGPILTKIEQKDDISKPILSVIVTISAGSSYDNLFREVPPVVPGGRISLYSLNMDRIDEFLQHLMNFQSSKIDEIKNLGKEMEDVSPDAVLFNFECCSGCSTNNYHFPQKGSTIKLISYLLERGHMVMCSDFAVRALINDWGKTLGPNPFVILGECRTFIELSFSPKALEESPSKQLQMVGQLCQTGKSFIDDVWPRTIVLGIDTTKIENELYTVSVLTIVTNTDGYDINSKKEYSWTIDDETGPVGHVLLKYKTGGMLLLTAVHWIELSKLNVNIHNLEEVALKNYGENHGYLEKINEIKNTEDEGERQTKINKMACKFVQQTAACNYSTNLKSEK